jgi:glycosyltransferase involved in cell wall biosynthesis
MGVSPCIIARNEDPNIGACIRGVADLVDEVCVIDIGSTDARAELASALGARVTRFPWCEDLSAASIRRSPLPLRPGSDGRRP